MSMFLFADKDDDDYRAEKRKSGTPWLDALIVEIERGGDDLSPQKAELSALVSEVEGLRRELDDKNEDRADEQERVIATLRADMQRLHNERTTLLMPGFTYLKNEELETLRAKAALADEAAELFAMAVVIPIQDPQHHARVDALGREIGYGATMATASRAWRDHLRVQGLEGGEFCCSPCRATAQNWLTRWESLK